jgi:membrane protease YdiL (CAAX protease family)
MVLRVVLFWCCYLVVLVAAWMMKAKVPVAWEQMVWGVGSSVALLALTAAFLWWERCTFGEVGMNVEAMSLPRWIAGMVIGLATFGVVVLLVRGFAGGMHFARGGASAQAMVMSGCTFLALACMEEIGFRGYALRTLVRALGMWPAQVIVAIAFGLCHLAYGWSGVNILLGVIPSALLFGFAATSSRGLAMPIGVHAGVNFAQWAVSGDAGIWKLVFGAQLRARVELLSRVVGVAVVLVVAFVFWRVQVWGERGDAE